MENLQRRIDERLMQLFSFKRVKDWYREGLCPQCGKKELYTHAINPRIVACGRVNKCGYSEHVRDICDELFKDWSQDYKQTEANPNAAADAYLFIGRGFDIAPLKGLYTQEFYRDKDSDQTTATVRFKLTPEGHYWQRFIDRPERFKEKAKFSYGFVNMTPLWSMHSLEQLAKASEIWITEGIFDSISLSQSGFISGASLSSTRYPADGLNKISEYCYQHKLDQPKLIWALDNDHSGRVETLKHIVTAEQAGWTCSAAQSSDDDRLKIDWNDLFLRQKLDEHHIRKYRHYGELLIAKTALQAGLLIYNFNECRFNSFYFHHRLKLYWFNLDIDKFSRAMDQQEKEDREQNKATNDDLLRDQALKNCSVVTEICNAEIIPLYYQRRDQTDEAWYYFQIKTQSKLIKEKFTSDQLSGRGKFKTRVMHLISAMWTGNESQLEIFVKQEIDEIKEVKTIDFIGYSKEHQAYIFNQVAVAQGRVVTLNEHDYFKLNRLEVKTLAKQPEIEVNIKREFKPFWWDDFLRINGIRGLIILGWWTGSYFAEQIRAMHSSYPFIEVCGEPGAGKSSLLEFLWRLSGQEAYEGFDPNKGSKTGAYRSFAQVANLPIVLIEGDRDSKDGSSQPVRQNFHWDEFKDAYNGRPIRTIGVKTNGNDTYAPPFKGALMISQNAEIDVAEAMMTRIIQIKLDRSGQTLEKKRIADQLYSHRVAELSPYMVHCIKHEKVFLETYKSQLTQLEQEFHASGVNHIRIAYCYSQIMALINAVAQHIIPAITQDTLTQTKQLLITLAKNRVTQLAADHPEVEKFWEVYDYLENLANHPVNHHKAEATTVAIHLNEFYEKASINRQSLADIRLIKQLLPNSIRFKFISKNHPVSSVKNADPTKPDAKRVVKCWIFQKPAH